MSEISDFIKSKLGRCSAGLSRSFRDYMIENGYAQCPENMELCYDKWISNVRFHQRSGVTNSPEIIELQRVYRTISNMEIKIRQLEKELDACHKNLRFKAPPSHVLKAMAEYGD